MSLAFRPATPTDLPLVYGSWLASFRLSHAAGLVPMATYGATYTDAIDRLLARKGCRVIVAHHPDEAPGAADVYGWACVEDGVPPALHYCYVIGPYRRKGLARALLEHAGIRVDSPWVYTYKTPVVAKLSSKLGRATWAPLRARDEER